MDDVQTKAESIESTSKGGYPPCTCGYGINKSEHYEIKAKAHFWKALYNKAKNQTVDYKQSISLAPDKANKILEQTIANLKVERSSIRSECKFKIVNIKKEAHKKIINALSPLKDKIAEQQHQITDIKEKTSKQQKQLNEEIKRLKQELESAKAQVAQFKKMVFGKKSEKQSASNAKASYGRRGKRRGQKKGTKGHGRTVIALPEKEEIVELPFPQNRCRRCHLSYQPMNATDDSEVIEIDISAHKRVIKRMKYKRHPHCNCYCSEKFRTAPLPGKCISKGKFGASVYANLLVGKFGYQIPLYRLIKQFELYGIPLSQGTITGGFHTLMPWIEPIYDQVVLLSQKAKHWHVDETGWKVFRKIKDKKTYNWYLWVYCNERSSVYALEPSRGMAVPEEFFSKINGGWLSSDRYLVYPKVAAKHRMINAFCWIHVRRDFINIYTSFPKLKHWAMTWINKINELFGINRLRTKAYKANDPHWEHQLELEDKIEEMRRRCNKQLESPHLHDEAKKNLKRLKKFWYGLTTFIGMPEVPMSNNYAESALRGPVVGRKNYYGSGSIWSARLTAMMFSVIETLKKWNVNPITWLTNYFETCAKYRNGPPWWVVNDLLPWDIPDSGFRIPLFD